MFRPLFDTCQDSLYRVAKPSSNYLNDPRRYSAYIHDHWVDSMSQFSTQSVDIIVSGMWNFKHINAKYLNGNVLIENLRMDSVTGSLKLWNRPNESVTLSYRASYFSLTIDHSYHDIKVKVPAYLECSNVTNMSNSSSFSPTIAQTTEIFELAVASFIGQSIYGK